MVVWDVVLACDVEVFEDIVIARCVKVAGIVVVSGSDEVVWGDVGLEFVVDVSMIVVVIEVVEVGDVDLVADVVLVGDVVLVRDVLLVCGVLLLGDVIAVKGSVIFGDVRFG